MQANLFVSFVTLTAYFLRIGYAAIEPMATKYVITKFKELPNLYEDLRSHQISKTTHESELTDDDIARRPCALIFGNDAIIDLDIPTNREKLKRDYPNIFDELFNEEETKPSLFKMKRFRSKRYNYDNAPKPRTFLVNGVEREEKTFACVIQNSNQTQIDMYYVSECVYDVNEGDHDSVDRLFGRFIFSGNQIYALAEELPRIAFKNHAVKEKYVEIRKRRKTAEKWEDDPVCKLDSGRKIRLCTYVCAVLYTGCEDKVAVQEPCVKREFHWLDTSYDEWMLNCIIRHRNLEGLEEETFFVSRTYRNHEAFFFKMPELFTKLCLVFNLRNVAVVIDEHQDGDCIERTVQRLIPK